MAVEPTSDSSQDTVFAQLEQYNWEKDREFQGGLAAILGPSPSPSQTQELTLRAQCFYFSRKKGLAIDFDAYKAYLASKHAPSQRSASPPIPSSLQVGEAVNTAASQPPSQTQTSSSPAAVAASAPLPWQVPQPNINPSQPAPAPSRTAAFKPSPDPANAPYPASFNDIVALIQAGEPVPGIEDIDATVAWGRGSKPSLKAQRKPWEKDLTEDQVQPGSRGGTFADDRDKWVEQELPDGDEPEFKGANWWKVVEQREREKSSQSKGDAVGVE